MSRFRTKLTLSVLCLASVGLSSLQAEARTFKNAYISFEMQDNWKCQLEQTEWVCRAEDPQEAKEAVIILTAKETGPTDSYEIYAGHMDNPINTVTQSGIPLTSLVKYKSQEQKINDQKWLDALHQDSEVPNYFTRYLATIKDQIAILVTFSAHNKHYAKHSPNFDRTIRSLRVIATKDLLNRPDLGPLHGSSDILGAPISGAMPTDLIAPEETAAHAKAKKSIFQNEMLIGLALFILAVLGYVGMKIYQKRR
ncbi:hypothetical protein [Pseudobdellovibrio exovorus]|uniref:Uncharacterized protein n=1 Tax=Pseudobdellovibrio exovorus JSS TaxID=1184267 RepID=M4V6S0_9BACT|nr:hypothetical protein [Pseudobdellovibrio exovorus]AGH95062.1 hypothetical protein A11Q_844 [Pseudobdellovibrio exovorus JSS]